jgi:trehalose 6-phosphate synthase
MRKSRAGELIVASNRLPIVIRSHDGIHEVKPSSGGLVAALGPVLEERGGAWIGWPGVADVPASALRETLDRAELGHEVLPVELTSEERDAFYLGFSNEIVWPLFHDLQTNCNFDPAYWEIYERVNRKFATAIAERVRPDDLIWVHDYHLMRVGAELRALGVDNRLGFFLHIPFPGPDTFRRLPWREPVAEGLLDFDLVGFQTERDAQNFLASMRCLQNLEPALDDGNGRARSYRHPAGNHVTRIGSFPIGIDLARERREAASEEAKAAERELRADVQCKHLVLGVDRLDYTKGIPERLEAFREALHRYPELRGDATLVQLVVPSRETIPEYSALREEVERLVGAINGELGEPGWVPVIYMHGTCDRVKLRGWYRAADVALITPLRDGMNLVAKEYCASRLDDRGALVLSEFAGAAEQLADGALLVNPHDRIECAEAIWRACRMGEPEQRQRMKAMRSVVEATDVFWWANTFLGELTPSAPELRAARAHA